MMFLVSTVASPTGLERGDEWRGIQLFAILQPHH